MSLSVTLKNNAASSVTILNVLSVDVSLRFLSENTENKGERSKRQRHMCRGLT